MATSSTGRCACGAVRYQLTTGFLIVHCCHCSWRQRETGSAFAINGMIETDNIAVTSGTPARRDIPSNSGAGQALVECAVCGVTLWSHYGAAREKIAFVRVGTLDEARAVTPDIHIFTSTKLPWIAIPPNAAAVPDYYRRADIWPADSIARYQAALGR